MKNLATLILALAIPAMAQTPPKPAPGPQLTKTETMAIHQIQQEFQQANQIQQQASSDLKSFSDDVATAHPGYVFDAPTGTLVPAPKPDPMKPSPIAIQNPASQVIASPTEKK